MRIEFFGIARQHAGIAHVDLRPIPQGQRITLGVCLQRLVECLPEANQIFANGQLADTLTINLNGDRFVRELETLVEEETAILILPRDAGG